MLEPGGDASILLYTLSFSLFIYGLMQGTHPRTAKNGNLIAAGGMAIAVITTLLLDGLGNWGVIIGGLVVGSAVGVVASLRVQMTEMPQMVALYNGVGGGAVALIAWSEFRHAPPDVPLDELIPVLFAAVIGSVSFWGSNIAFAKLQDLIPTRPLAVPGQQVINALLLIGILVACVVLVSNNGDLSGYEGLFIAVLVAAALLGNLVVLPIGGADMPVVISLLNAFTGLSAAAAGFSLDNVALIVAGTLVGSSGTILTMEMATAMNRSVANILFSGFGGAPAAGAGSGEERPHTSIGAQDAAIKLAYADSVVIVPGYGLAVAQAQHAVKEMADELEKRGVEVNYAIHPVAGRMPGPHERAARRGRRPLREAARDGRHQPGDAAHRRRRGDRRQRRHQPGGQERPGLADRRDADHRGLRGPAGDRDQALAVARVRRDRQRPLLRGEHLDAVRRREEGGGRDRRRDHGALAAHGRVRADPLADLEASLGDQRRELGAGVDVELAVDAAEVKRRSSSGSGRAPRRPRGWSPPRATARGDAHLLGRELVGVARSGARSTAPAARSSSRACSTPERRRRAARRSRAPREAARAPRPGAGRGAGASRRRAACAPRSNGTLGLVVQLERPLELGLERARRRPGRGSGRPARAASGDLAALGLVARAPRVSRAASSARPRARRPRPDRVPRGRSAGPRGPASSASACACSSCSIASVGAAEAELEEAEAGQSTRAGRCRSRPARRSRRPLAASSRASCSRPRAAWMRARTMSAIESGPSWPETSAFATASSASRSASSQSPSR